jgi:raffinose/stachyose/melibiose transport system permease protein
VSSIVLILFLGALAAHALAEYEFTGRELVGFYLMMGIMIPIRLGTVSILRIMVGLGLVNTLLALILVYTASGLPIAIFILRQFFQQVPRDLIDAGRVDGASEYRIFWLILPIVRPAMATVAVFTMIPAWNDLWFPLILAPADNVKTVVLGTQRFFGQYVTDWSALLSVLTVAALPVIILYILFSRQLVSGLTSGVIK